MKNNLIIILIFTVSIVDGFFDEVPRCLSGRRPLLDENLKLFPCHHSNCPDKFYCEKQQTKHLFKNQTRSFCCPNSTLLSSPADAAEISFQIESSTELLRSLSCERFPYHQTCSKSKNDSQPIIMYYFDVQTLNCELYPYGLCENDPKLTLRTKKECERRCDVQKLKEALDMLEENGLEDITIPDSPQIAIDDTKTESKHLRGHPPPPTDIEIQHRSENLILEDLEGSGNKISSYEDINEILLSGSQVPREVVIIEDDLVEGEGSGSQDEDPIVTSGTSTTPGSSTSEASRTSTQETSTASRTSTQRSVASRTLQPECLASPYRLLCQTGKPSQFVYRWEVLDGKCQSFPYGYCWKEHNLPHPRTQAECESYCVTELSSKF
ncbi:unnamed protein product [Caenorhabditis angaria]|uniref:BPTI/Kunitz inhibitor domain-containing protein n=1 Tax=Caenorhabditis angaria TaxID=860376 RepID=A0A9P1N7I8_9PELO|nr:unnamed protein product [Caenorhabditis angaria]